MAGEENAGTGGGTPGSGQTGAGTGGTPQGTPAGAGGQREGGGAGAQGGTREPVGGQQPQQTFDGIPRNALPEELQGKSDAEIKFILGNMTKAVRSQAQKIKDLEAKGQQAPKPEPKEEKPERPIEERVLEDPESVIAEVVERRYGTVIQGLDQRTARSELAAARADIDDFREYEEDVRVMLKEAGAPETYENLAGAYTMVVGQKAIEAKRQQKQQGIGMESGGGSPPEPDKNKPKLTDLEREIAAAQGISDEDFVKYRNAEVADMIKIPTGKAENNG